MKTSERFTVYIVGFLVGMVIVSMMMARRAAKRDQAIDPWHQHHEQVQAAGVEPLPEGVQAAMLEGGSTPVWLFTRPGIGKGACVVAEFSEKLPLCARRRES